jgi:hypothetical protein
LCSVGGLDSTIYDAGHGGAPIPLCINIKGECDRFPRLHCV